MSTVAKASEMTFGVGKMENLKHFSAAWIEVEEEIGGQIVKVRQITLIVALKRSKAKRNGVQGESCFVFIK